MEISLRHLCLCRLRSVACSRSLGAGHVMCVKPLVIKDSCVAAFLGFNISLVSGCGVFLQALPQLIGSLSAYLGLFLCGLVEIFTNSKKYLQMTLSFGGI